MSLDERRGWIANHHEFFDFLESRPDEERWELVDGVPVMMNPPVLRHGDIRFEAMMVLDPIASAMGLGVHSEIAVRSNREPDRVAIPDIVLCERGEPDAWWIDRPVVVVEVLSPSTRRADLGWKKRFYTRFPTLEHYLVLETDVVTGRLYSRAEDFAVRMLASPDAEVALDALGARVPLARFYRRAGLAG